MKVALKVTVEMTSEEVANYCKFEGVDRNELREDIRQYVQTALQDSPSFQYQADITVRAAS
jgi:hypothetical protein